MRQSQKAWMWRSIPALAAGSLIEASAAAKGTEDRDEHHVLKGKNRNLLPRT